jgi:hypothetical protein
LCIRNGTLDLELLRPLDYVEPTPSLPPVERPGTPIPPPITHVNPSREERRLLAAAAAEARMAQAKKLT